MSSALGYRLAVSMVGEDMVQESTIRAWRGRRPYDSRTLASSVPIS
jgi:DNA-directed RNA polymerase specialized sigma24 family protein